ncbi:catalase [Psychrobacter sp. JCM 18903]|nr:catalase [Psychrobacter sp. JCM 18903]
MSNDMSDKKCPYAPTQLTMGNGAPVADNQNSMTAGKRVHYWRKMFGSMKS